MAKRKAPRPPTGQRRAATAPSPESTARFDGWVPILAPLAAVWMLIGVTELSFNALIGGTALNNGLLPLTAAITLAAYSLAALVPAICAIALLGWVVDRIVQPGAHPIAVWGSRAARGAIVATGVFLYFSSWALFWNTGVFLDRQAFAFLAAMNPVQVFHWVYPPLAIGVIAATLVATFALAQLVPSWVSRRSAGSQRRLAIAGVGGPVACCLIALVGWLAYGSLSEQADQPKSAYAVSRDGQSGPVLHAAADVVRILRPPEPPAVASSDTDKVIRRPIISMNEYVSRVSQADFKRFNVVMVQIESLRSDQLQVYGGTRDVMPAVDALARDSRVFTNAYIQASHSNYQDLVPLSSHYPLRSTDMHEYPPNPTYPRVLVYDVLKALGYRTAIFSSQNERWGGMLNYHRPENLDRFFHAETFSGPTITPWEDMGFAAWVRETKGAGSVDDKYTMSEAIQWIDSVSSEPFFVHMNLQSSHVPYVVPDGFPRRFSPKDIDFAIMWGKFPIEKTDIVKGRYADSLYYEDTQIARLFEHLKKRGVWDKTIVVIGGDNGEAFYEHGFAAHASSLFNEVVKVPMIIRAPGLTPGLDDRPAMLLDVPPSLFELLGLPPHPSFQGIGLFNTPPVADRSLYMIVQTPAAFQSAIVRSGFKLLHNELDGRYYLWDQVNDPGERKPLTASRPDLVEDLAARLRFWRAEQLSYYADVPRQSREYPPVVKD
jgi:arylsulfatase A-like enzyme